MMKNNIQQVSDEMNYADYNEGIQVLMDHQREQFSYEMIHVAASVAFTDIHGLVEVLRMEGMQHTMRIDTEMIDLEESDSRLSIIKAIRLNDEGFQTLVSIDSQIDASTELFADNEEEECMMMAYEGISAEEAHHIRIQQEEEVMKPSKWTIYSKLNAALGVAFGALTVKYAMDPAVMSKQQSRRRHAVSFIGTAVSIGLHVMHAKTKNK